MVIAYALDRFTRNQVHLGVLIDDLDRHGARLELVTEDFEDSTTGRFIRNAKAFAAELELEKIKERNNRARRARAKSGKPIHGPRTPFGYLWRDGAPNEAGKAAKKIALVPDPATAPIVRQIFADAAGGLPLRTIAQRLTDAGVPTPSGAVVWHRSSVHQMLTNPAYSGVAAAYRWARRGKNGEGKAESTRVLRPSDEQIALPDGTIAPLVDAATFAAVQARLRQNQDEAPRNNRSAPDALLRAGFAVCGLCGRNMRVAHGWRGPRYTCRAAAERPGVCKRHAMSAAMIDAKVWNKVSAVLDDPSLIRRKWQEQRTIDPFVGDLEALDRQVADIQRKRGNLIDRLADTDDAEVAAAIQEKIAELTEGRRRIDAERETLSTRRAAVAADEARLDALVAMCERVRSRLQGADYEMQRLALHYLDVRVLIYPEGHFGVGADRDVIEMLTDPASAIVSSTSPGGSR